MALELKDLQEFVKYIGIDIDLEKTTVQDLKAQFEPKYLAKEHAHTNEEIRSKVAGEYFNKNTNYIKKLWDLPTEKVQDKDGKTLPLETILSNIKESVDSQLTELKTQAHSTNDKKVNDLSAQLQEKSKDFEQLQQEFTKTIQQKESTIQQYQKSIYEKDLQQLLQKEKSQVPLSQNVSPLTLKGFEVELHNKYNFELNEKGDSIVIKDKEGQLVFSKEKAGQPATAKEIYELEAKSNNLLKLNDNINQPSATTFRANPDANPQGYIRKVAPPIK